MVGEERRAPHARSTVGEERGAPHAWSTVGERPAAPYAQSTLRGLFGNSHTRSESRLYATPSTCPTSRSLQAAEIAQLEPDDDEEHRQHEERDGGALAEQSGGHADLIGVRRQQVGGVG